MRLLNYLKWIFLSIFFLLNSCKGEDLNKNLCGTAECQNDGICIDGYCDCPTGFSGRFCEVNQSIQQRLDEGSETPIEMIQSGVKLEDLYGKRYEGGLIFYINANQELNPDFNDSGLIATSEINTEEWRWGCDDINSLVQDVESDEITIGVRIGDGYSNTLKILESNCPVLNLSAAAQCYNYETNGFNDWYLPSREELRILCINLAHLNLGISDAPYWSSSEVNDSRSWYKGFSSCETNSGHKQATARIHPIRSF